MRRGVSLLMIGLLCAVSAVAQIQEMRKPPPRQRQKPASETTPLGEQKLRWICRHLRLDERQMQQAEALIAVHNAEMKELKENAAELLRRIEDKYAEVQAAQAAGDAEAVTRLRGELRNMAPGVQAENHFFDGLEQLLTEEQKTKLPAIRQRAKTLKDISLRPIHVLRAVRKVTLTSEQSRQLEQILEDFRTTMAGNRPENQEEGAERVERLVKDIRAILTPEQSEAYDREIEELRAAPPAPKPMQLSEDKARPPPPRPPVVRSKPKEPEE